MCVYGGGGQPEQLNGGLSCRVAGAIDREIDRDR